MFYRLTWLIVLVAMTGTHGNVFAAPGEDDFGTQSQNYLAVQLNGANVDSDRRVDGNGIGASVIYGFSFRRNFFLEARITGLVLERGEDGGTDFYQQDIGVDAIYRFGKPGGWQPFVAGGITMIRNDVDIDEDDGISAGARLGGGVVSPPLGNMDIRFRADLDYVHDQFLDGMQDIRVGLGIQIPLGNTRADTSRQLAGKSGSADRDGDGVADSVDRCLNSLSYVRHDATGCMAPKQTIRLYEATFNNGTSILTPAAREELAAIVLALRGQPDMPIQINGHTDAWGTAEENRALSRDRAEAVATYLALQGIPTQRISVKGFGETQPVDTNATAEGRERNRRIEIVLLEPLSH